MRILASACLWYVATTLTASVVGNDELSDILSENN